MPNAMEVGPDGMLYFPVMGTNEIWRVGLDGGAPEKVAGDLGVPDAVKFDAQGYIVSTQVASGQVLRIDPRTGERTVLADIAPGLDNLTFVGDRLFVSSISGQINEILGRRQDPLAGAGRLELAAGSGAWARTACSFVADGRFTYTLRPGGALQVAGMFFTPGCPGYIRGVAAAGPGEMIVTTANGAGCALAARAAQRARCWPRGSISCTAWRIAPGGAVVFAEAGTGRVLSVRSGNVEELATGLREPMGVAVGADGTCCVAESGAGRVLRLAAWPRRNRAGRPAAAAGHIACAGTAVRRRCGRQGTDRIRHAQQGPPYHCR